MFSGISLVQLIHELEEGVRLPKPYCCPTQIDKIISQCFMANPSDRPSFEVIKCDIELAYEQLSKGTKQYDNTSQEQLQYADLQLKQQPVRSINVLGNSQENVHLYHSSGFHSRKPEVYPSSRYIPLTSYAKNENIFNDDLNYSDLEFKSQYCDMRCNTSSDFFGKHSFSHDKNIATDNVKNNTKTPCRTSITSILGAMTPEPIKRAFSFGFESSPTAIEKVLKKGRSTKSLQFSYERI